jgi:hypothetical protein
MTVSPRSTVQSRAVATAVLLTMLFSGCRMIDPILGRGPRGSQSAILDASTDYDVGPETGATTETDRAFPGPTAPDTAAPRRITLAAMHLKPGRPRGPRQLLARITSDKDYPLMGIVEGQNFVWRNTWDSTAVAAATWINTVTPAAAGHPDHVLRRDPRLNRYPALVAPHQPRLLKLIVNSFAFIACLDDPGCGTGHCGYY